MTQPADDAQPLAPNEPDLRGREYQPIFNIPSVLVWILAALFVVHGVRTFLLSQDMDNWLVTETAFVPLRYAQALTLADPAWLWTWLSYGFLHGGAQHLIFNSLWMVVFGTPVARRIGTLRFCLFWIAASFASAFFFLVFHQKEVVFLMGASGVISALTAAACRFAWSGRSREGTSGPTLSIVEALTTRSVLMFIAVWALGNVVLAAYPAFQASAGAPIAWEAHLGGFLFGFFAFPLFDRRPR